MTLNATVQWLTKLMYATLFHMATFHDISFLDHGIIKLEILYINIIIQYALSIPHNFTPFGY